MSSYITQNVNRTLVVAENTFTELEHFAQAAAANVTTASEPPQTPSSTSAATVSPPPPTDEQLQKEFRERYGANRTPDEHRAAWLAAHANDPPSPFAGDPIRYASAEANKPVACSCGLSCTAM